MSKSKNTGVVKMCEININNKIKVDFPWEILQLIIDTYNQCSM